MPSLFRRVGGLVAHALTTSMKQARWFVHPAIWVVWLAWTMPGLGQSITKVEPPDWPTVQRPTSLQLLITGEALAQAQLRSATPGVTPGKVEVSPDGRYAFCDLNVTPAARPGSPQLDNAKRSSRRVVVTVYALASDGSLSWLVAG